MAESEAPPSSNRRAGERYLACFPAALTRADGQERPSIIRELSESGALLLVRTTKVAVGDQVMLQLFIMEDTATFRSVRARIVRVEDLSPADAGPWLRRVAVRFDEALTVCAQEIASFKERAQRLGLVT